MNERRDIQGMDTVYGCEVLRNHFSWYNSFDDLDFIPVPLEDFVQVQDYSGAWYRIPRRLHQYFFAALTKGELQSKFDHFREPLNDAA